MTAQRNIQPLKEPIFVQLLKLLCPIALGSILQQAFSLADAVVVGRMVGKGALAAVCGTNLSLINFIIILFAGLSSGAMIVSSQFYGAKDCKEINETFRASIFVSLIFGLVVMVFFGCFAPTFHRLMKTPESIFVDSVNYLRFYFLGIVPTLVFNMCSSIFRSVGDAKSPLLFLFVSIMVNILLDLVFVIFFHFGVVGVAIASGLSQLLSCFLIFYRMKAVLKNEQYSSEKLPNLRVANKILKFGVPAGLQNAMYLLAGLFAQRGINILGADAVSGWAIFYKIDGLYWALSSSFNIAVSVLAGQYYGAKEYNRLKECALCGMISYSAMSIVFSLSVVFGRNNLARLFSSDVNVIFVAGHVFVYVCSTYVVFGPSEIFGAVIRGAGEIRKPTMITCFAICLLRITIIYFYTFPNLSNFSIAFFYPLTWLVSSVLFSLYFFFGKWLKTSEKPDSYLSL